MDILIHLMDGSEKLATSKLDIMGIVNQLRLDRARMIRREVRIIYYWESESVRNIPFRMNIFYSIGALKSICRKNLDPIHVNDLR